MHGSQLVPGGKTYRRLWGMENQRLGGAGMTQLKRYRRWFTEVDPKRNTSAWQHFQHVTFSIHNEEKLTGATDNPMSADFAQALAVAGPRRNKSIFQSLFWLRRALGS